MKANGAPEHWINKPRQESREGLDEFIKVLKMLYPDISDFGTNQAIKYLRLYLAGYVPTVTCTDARGG